MEINHKSIAIIGFGNQARAWAQNLRDSGFEVVIYLRENSKSYSLVKEMNFKIIPKNELNNYQNIALLTPDESHKEVLNQIGDHLKDNSIIIYAHGFPILYGDILTRYSQFQHALLAPKAIASELRFQFECKGGLGGVYSSEHCENPEVKKVLLQIGEGLGLKVLHESTFEQETVADLFSEQSILCSIIPYAAAKSFNKLVENGIDEEVAYFECWYEVKLIVDTLVKVGPYDFFNLISPNALMGSEVGKSLFFDMDFEKKMDDMFNNIKSGHFVTSIKDQNYDQIKNDVLNFWKDQKLNIIHTQLKDQLF